MEESKQNESEENQLAKAYTYLNIASKLYKERTTRSLAKDVINATYHQAHDSSDEKSVDDYVDQDLADIVNFHLNSVIYNVELAVIDGSSIKLAVRSMPGKAEDIIDGLYSKEGILKITPEGTKSTVAVPIENITSIVVHEGTVSDEQ